MKKVSPFMWSLGIGSALALLMLKPENRKTIRQVIRRVKTAQTTNEEGIYYI